MTHYFYNVDFRNLCITFRNRRTKMIEQLYQAFQNSTGVSTDTRTLKKGNLWFALKGPNYNANAFAEDAIKQGAAYVVIDDPSHAKGAYYLVVDDGLKALQALAIHHRKQFQIPFIGITGSNGKTTTKELIRDVLAKKYRVSATKGNLNNHIGVPLSVLEVNQSTEIAIIEMGANKVGDIAELCSYADPSHGLITNIGKAHLEGFGGMEGVIRGKTELYHHLIQRKGKIFVNSNSDILRNIAERRMEVPYMYPNPGDYFTARLIQQHPSILFEMPDGAKCESQLSGTYNFENICSALCLGTFFDVSQDDMLRAIAGYVPDNNRSQLLQKGSNLIYMDAYNANPTSMQLALQNFALGSGKKVAILGDMFELGEDAEKEHSVMGKLIKDLSIERVFVCGQMMKNAFEANDQILYFKTKEALSKYLKKNPIKDAKILLKASRGMALETLLPELEA